MIDFIKDKLNIRRDVYKRDPNIIIEDYRKEIEKIEEYNGRQILEMLQNADDEAAPATDKTCYIKLSDKQLVIANNGNQFSKGGIESLMYSNLSPKLLQQNKVGQKGLGFRSILSWANKITIKSHDFMVEFSKDNAIHFLKSLINEVPSIKNDLEKKEKNEQFPIATLRCPKIIETIPKKLVDYDTYIIIDLKNNIIDDVQKQINNEIDKEVMLFLNNLETIIIESPEKNLIIKKHVKRNSIQVTTFTSHNEIINSKEWNIKSKTGIHNRKNYELKIAWNNSLDDKIGRLYTYFKTNVKFPFPALIHGTFELSSNRNELINDTSGHNRFLLEELIELLIETALEISNKTISYDALILLGFYNLDSWDTFFEDNEFEEKLKERIRSSDLFPTIGNKYISCSDNPVFYQNNYSALLPEKTFSNLLLHTENDEIIQTLEWLNINEIYVEEYFFTKISEVSSQFDIVQRALLISYIIDDYRSSNISRKKLPNIFIDQNNIPIESSSDIFLPPSGEDIDIPMNLKLKIINSQLYAELKKIFKIDNAEVIENKLILFNVKVYRFSEIFRRIVSDFNKRTKNGYINNKNDIKIFLSNLYELYISNRDKIDITIPSNISIPILNQNNLETKVSKVYLGIDYGNKLCEILFAYDKNKLVADPKKLGLEDKEFVREFIEWLGVAKYPRKKIVTVKDSSYSKFVIEQFPYKEKFIYSYDKTIDSYNKLKKKGYYVPEVKAEIIEDLDEILLNNSNENIIYWLAMDNRIHQKKESNQESYISINIFEKRYSSKISYDDMPSYLLWKFSEINWLKTITKKSVKPTECCISKTITPEFSPFIEIPMIKNMDDLFVEEKISIEDINFYLNHIGVHKDISSFSTDTIYSMLLNLKDIDKDGKKAKLIYREIIENIEEKLIDKKSQKYLEFIENGYVFCILGQKKLYEKVSNVYYVENKIFGEDVINKFKVIEIDRRKGQKKVKNIFGVEPLASLNFQLKSQPELHPLNEKFQKEIEELKPYIYTFRISKDSKEDELKWIQKSKIYICVTLNTEYEYNSDFQEFNLKSYEFITKGNETYLLLDENLEYSTFSDMQNDYKFSDAIAEIFSSILKVDAHRSSIRELFKENLINRNYILESELDDIGLKKLRKAKNKLDIVDDPKIQFWFSILSAKNLSYQYEKYSDQKFKELIQDKLKLNITDYQLNYADINIASNFSIIIDIFNTLDIDIIDFNKYSTKALQINSYFLNELEQLKNMYQHKFEILLYKSLINDIDIMKEELIDNIFYYEQLRDFCIENSVKVELKKLLFDTVKKEFGVDLSSAYKEIDIKAVYNKNYGVLKNLISSLDEKALLEVLEKNENLRSLIYFAKFEKIINKYTDYINQRMHTNKININGSPLIIANDDFLNLYKMILEQEPITTIENIKTIKPDITKGKQQGKNKGPKHISNSDKEMLGFIGEVFVFETLKDKFGDNNVIWDSGYARKANINPMGDDNKHYDISYTNKEGQRIYVEVKTTTSSNLEFKISNSEVKFGELNKNNYEIMIVVNALDIKKNRKIKKLVKPFKYRNGETFTSNSKYFVKNDNFTIKLKEI